MTGIGARRRQRLLAALELVAPKAMTTEHLAAVTGMSIEAAAKHLLRLQDRDLVEGRPVLIDGDPSYAYRRRQGYANRPSLPSPPVVSWP